MPSHKLNLDFAKLYYYCSIGLLAVLPFSIKGFGLIALLCLALWILEGGFGDKLKVLKTKSVLLLVLLLFLIEGLSLFYSHDYVEGYSQVEKRIIPVILIVTLGSSLALSKIEQHNLFAFFTVVVILLCLICYINAVLKTNQLYPNYDPDKFYYSYDFSRATYGQIISDIHPGYFSMFILFAISLLLNTILTKRPKYHLTALYTLGIMFLLLNLIFLSSKIHLALLFVIIFYFLFKSISLINSSRKKIIIFIGGFLSMVTLTYFILQDGQMQYRLNNEISSSITEKYEQWRSAAQVWSQNPLLGVGMGDRQLELDKVYVQNGFNESIGRNPHSQYFDYLIATGLLGFSIFALIIIKMFELSIKKSTNYMLLFNVIWSFSCLTESIFVRFWGLGFFVLFTIFLTQDHE